MNRVIIYLRPSSSAEESERRLRARLDDLGIEHSGALLLTDDTSGRPTRRPRPARARLYAEIDRDPKMTLVVAEASRLGRRVSELSRLYAVLDAGGLIVSLAGNFDGTAAGRATLTLTCSVRAFVDELNAKVRRPRGRSRK